MAAVGEERLRQQVWDGYLRVCTAYDEAQNWRQGITMARRWLHLDPLDENIHQWLMKFLAANGQKTAALEQFARCRKLLWEELGVEPDAKTIALFNQIQQLPEKTLPAFGAGQTGLKSPAPSDGPNRAPCRPILTCPIIAMPFLPGVRLSCSN
ncbi:MAG: bacterial transcriptional activator domain-containing protein [Chloroflexota bacterium]